MPRITRLLRATVIIVRKDVTYASTMTAILFMSFSVDFIDFNRGSFIKKLEKIKQTIPSSSESILTNMKLPIIV